MKITAYPQMLLSYHEGWTELARQRPAAAATLLRLVLPAVLLPVAMILYAASRHGAYYAPGTPVGAWMVIAELFFVAQLLSVLMMAWLVRALARSRGFDCGFDRALQLTATSAVPLWLSSLTLLLPNMLFNAVSVLAGLLAAFSLMFHGLPAMVGEDEGLAAMDMAYTVLCAGAALWALLCALVLLPLL